MFSRTAMDAVVATVVAVAAYMIVDMLLIAAGPPDKGVNYYIERTGDEDFAARQEASSKLAQMGQKAYPALIKAAKAHPDPETRKRCKTAADGIRASCFVQLGELPWIDALWYSPESRGYLLPSRGLSPLPKKLWGELETAVGAIDRSRLGGYLTGAGLGDHEDEPWPSYRLATRLWVGDLLDANVKLDTIKKVLDVMRERDKLYMGTRGVKLEKKGPDL